MSFRTKVTAGLSAALALAVVVGVLRHWPGTALAGEKKGADPAKALVKGGQKIEIKKDEEKKTAEELRLRYLQLQDELSRHLPAAEVQRKIAELERQVVAAKEGSRKALREKNAAEALEKVKIMLNDLAAAYSDTAAGSQARQALRVIIDMEAKVKVILPPLPPPPPKL